MPESPVLRGNKPKLKKTGTPGESPEGAIFLLVLNFDLH